MSPANLESVTDTRGCSNRLLRLVRWPWICLHLKDFAPRPYSIGVPKADSESVQRADSKSRGDKARAGTQTQQSRRHFFEMVELCFLNLDASGEIATLPVGRELPGKTDGVLGFGLDVHIRCKKNWGSLNRNWLRPSPVG